MMENFYPLSFSCQDMKVMATNVIKELYGICNLEEIVYIHMMSLSNVWYKNMLCIRLDRNIWFLRSIVQNLFQEQ